MSSQAVWLRRILKDVGEKQDNVTKLFCDNKSTIAMAKNSNYSSRTRHIAAKYHFIREKVDEGVIEPKFCKSKDQVADIFTKALLKENFIKFCELLGVQERKH